MAALHRHCRIIPAAVLLIFLSGAISSEPLAADERWRPDEPIELLLRDGRRVIGTVDGRSSHDLLWLNTRMAGVELASRYPWDDVVEIAQGPTPLSVDELLTQLDSAKLPAIPERPGLEGPGSTVLIQNAPGAEDLLPASPPLTARVQALQIDARLANWDADAPADGLLVTIYPQTSLGDWTPVRGNLDLWLLGEVWPRPEQPYRYPRSGFQELGRASHLVREVDFSHGPATFQLPLRHVHPEAMHAIATYGIVHARLGVNGQGVFEAADSFVRLRQASPTRDRLQLFHGQRFFPIERPPRLP